MATAVIYARFSSSKQREASIDDQLRVCNDYCDREGITVLKSYCDYAISGRTDDRPQFQQMIANAGESDIVVVYMMDRFSRDPYDAPIYKKQLSKHGVRVVSALEYVDASPDGIIMEKLLEGLAARESMVTAIRTKRGMEGNAQKCLYNGDRVYGYSVDDTKHYVINEEQAAFVREAFQRRLRRESVSSIAKDFAIRGVETYSGRPCSSTMVWNMLKNERYIGVYKWGDVRVEGGMPQIIDRDTFDAVQTVKGKKQHKLEKYADYALSGKSVCGLCGNNMVGVSAYNHAKKRYDYYRCGKKCGAKMLGREKVEASIVDELRKILESDEAYRIADMVKRDWDKRNSSQDKEDALKRLRKAQSGIDNILKAVEEGMPYSAVKGRMEELQAMEKRAKEDYDRHNIDIEFDVDDFVTFLRFGATLDDKTLLNAFVKHVIFMEDRLIVALNYSINSTNTPRTLEVFVQNLNGSPLPTLYEHVSVVQGVVVLVIPRAA